MSLKVHKTGLAARMRAWMSGQKKPFTARKVCYALDMVSIESCDKVGYAMHDFERRGEVIMEVRRAKQDWRQPAALYRYNHDWKNGHRAVLMPKIIKAIYVAGIFSCGDIVRLSEAPDRGFVDYIIRKLREKGMIVNVGRRRCASGTAAENLYNIPNRDRFRLEVMG